MPNCQVPDGGFWTAVNFNIQELKFFDSVSLMTGKFDGIREFLFQEIRAPWIFRYTALVFSWELCKLIRFRPLTVFCCAQLLQESWLERLTRFRFYMYILENHIMIYIEAEKKRSLGSVARGISVGRKLVSKQLSLHLIF